MSGFAGIVRLEPTLETAEADRAAIASMAQAIAFRGPDAQQQWHRDGASFAFSLLTTGPAPQSTAQPVTLDGETWLLGDVRCDGRDDLIRKLEQHRVQVSRTATSEELVLHYYAKFGAEAFPELLGDFSFVLWKPKEGRLLAFRDLTGSRPFFYSWRGGAFCFSNTVQAVLSLPIVRRSRYDLQFLCDFLLDAPHQDPDRTVYCDIRRLPAAHLLEFSASDVSTRRIANFPIEDELTYKRDEEVIEEFRRLFRQSVADRLPLTKTALFLSGGLDSTTVATTAVSLRHQHAPDRELALHALSASLQPLFDDGELAYSEPFAKSMSIPLQVVRWGDMRPFDGALGNAAHLPEPVPWPYWTLVSLFFVHIAKHSRVALHGDGGDEILRCQPAPYLRHVAARRGVVAAARVLLSYSISRRRIPPPGLGIRTWVYRQMRLPTALPEFPPWFTPEATQEFSLRDRFRETSKTVWVHPVNPRAYAFFNGYRFATAMEEQDATWTHTPVESRGPFLDRRLVRFLLRLPPIPWFMNKELVRRAQKGIVPEAIRLRPKTPLKQEPIIVQVDSGKWSPEAPQICPDPLGRLVDWRSVTSLFSSASGSDLYLHIRPVLLALWLHAVVNGHSLS